jgi:site-specific recombinase XerD
MTTPQLGESPKVVQTTLGHSKIAITLDIYSHVSLDLEKRAAARLNAALREQALSSAVAGNNYERCLANH